MSFCDVFPPSPNFTEEHLPNLSGKVFIVTGGSSGVGLELTKLLYSKNGTVFIATRSLAKIQSAIDVARSTYPTSEGRLEPLVLDLSDLATVRPAAMSFLSQESRLDVLFNNAGIMFAPPEARTAQGHESQMGTNALGHYLLTKCLEPILVRTAEANQAAGTGRKWDGGVRIVNVVSWMDVGVPKGVIEWDDTSTRPKVLTKSMDNYMMSKVGLTYISADIAQRLGSKGVIAVSVHPGLMKTELQRTQRMTQSMMGIMFKPAKYGAYTEIFAGFSQNITRERNGAYILPWGRFGKLPENVAQGIKKQSEGGNGMKDRFLAFCERETVRYFG